MPGASRTSLGLENVASTVQAQVPPHFQDAQHSLASHRKNVVSLYRVHAACAQVTEATPRGTRLVGEKAFNECFLQCLNRVLAQKKGVANADRVCKYVAAYAAYAQEQFRAAALKAHGEAAEEEDTTATRFVNILFKHLLKGFPARDKNVRLRCCGCVALLINGLESLDEGMFDTLSRFLLERTHDREASVRVQAVVALARLQMGEEEEAGGAQTTTSRLLLHMLRYDPSAEVRRAALFNTTPRAATLPYLLERLQDVDATNRRCVYQGSLRMLLDAQPRVEHEGHSVVAALGLSDRAAAEVVRTGMHERDPTVRRAARKLAGHWLDACGGDLLLLLDQLHVAQSDCGESVVMALFDDRHEVLAHAGVLLADPEAYWREMTPGKALLAKCFVLYCTHNQLESRLEACLPPVTALAFHTQREYEQLSDLLEQQAAEEMEDDMPAVQDEQSGERVFVVNELLAIAMHCDYGDEVGRRKMFMLVREMLGNAWLPSTLVPRCLDVLLGLASDQRDYVQMVVELAQVIDGGEEGEEGEESEEGEEGEEGEDGGEGPEGQEGGEDAEAAQAAEPAADASVDAGDHSVRESLSWSVRLGRPASPAAAAHRAALDARRLLIVRCMLERVASSLRDNTALHGLIPQLIVPAVRSTDAEVREQGLVCLGLCSLLDDKMALDTFPLFLDQIQRASGTIRVRCIECLFDLLLVHGVDVLCARSAEVAARTDFDGDMERGLAFARQQMLGFLLSLLEHDDADVQAAAAVGLAKLLLTGGVVEDDVLKSLVLIYMSPDTAENQPLRQCLSYFLPLFCSSHARHQRIIQRVFVDTFDVLAQVHAEKDSETRMVSPAQVALQLADWANPEKLMLSTPDETVHVDLCLDVLKHLCTLSDKVQRRALTQLLGKLFLPPALDEARVKALALLVHTAQQRAAGDDAVVRNAFARFAQTLERRYAPVLDAWNPALAAHDGTLAAPEMQALGAFLADLPEAVPAAPRAASRRPAARGRARTPRRRDPSDTQSDAETPVSDDSEPEASGPAAEEAESPAEDPGELDTSEDELGL